MAQGTTIAAIATAIVPQQGSIGIVRLSGPEAIAIARQLFRVPGRQVWESHRVLYGYIHDPASQALLDEALLLLMFGPRSYTREDIVEFHCHGGMMPVQQVLQACLALGARLAQPGEFTLRAFLNGRLDLTQAEGIAELVGARSPQAAQTALAGLQGKLAHPIRQLRHQCLDCLAEIEARIDFADDLPPLDEAAVVSQIQAIAAVIQALLTTRDRGELLRTGLKVAIVGRPNVGKSSLLNAWSRSDRAIVTELPGTTRDVVESSLVVQGIPVQVLDTAGIRETADPVEQIGVARSQQAAQQADLVLLTVEAPSGWTDADQVLYEAMGHLGREGTPLKPLILIINKVDLASPQQVAYPQAIQQVVHTAAAQQQGIDQLEMAIAQLALSGSIQAANVDLAINQRQAEALGRAHQALDHVVTSIAAQMPLDFWSIDLRGAIQALGEVTGEEVTESVLDRIFSRFCIGK